MNDAPSDYGPLNSPSPRSSAESGSQRVAAAAARSPFQILQETASAFWLSRCLHVVADLGVADVLGDEPASAAQLAAATGAHAEALLRALRLVASHEIFSQDDAGRWSHTPASRLLRADHPQSVRSYVRMLGLPPMWHCAGALRRAVETGSPVGKDVVEGGFWNYVANNSEANTVFNEAMRGKALAQVRAVVERYDFSPFARIADIGGGQGHLIQAIVNATSRAQGVLFDQPHVVEQAHAIASDRLVLQGGNFFTDELPAADAYILMEVIHDWGDAESDAILRSVRRAAPAHAKLLLIEALIPDDPGPNWIKTLDIIMLDLLGGSQRSYAEYGSLLARCGFRLDRKIDVGLDYWILEASVQ